MDDTDVSPPGPTMLVPVIRVYYNDTNLMSL